MGERARNAGPLMADLAIMMAKSADEMFTQQGPGWAKLAPSTVKAKGSSIILIDSGGMRKSVKGASGSDYASITIDTPAGFHMEGGPHLPQRDPLAFFSDAAVDEAATLMLDWILE